MIKTGGAQKNENNENREEIINFAEIRGIWNMHHWLRGWTPLFQRNSLIPNTFNVCVWVSPSMLSEDLILKLVQSVHRVFKACGAHS